MPHTESPLQLCSEAVPEGGPCASPLGASIAPHVAQPYIGTEWHNA